MSIHLQEDTRSVHDIPMEVDDSTLMTHHNLSTYLNVQGYAYVEYDLPESSQLAIEQMQDTKLLNRAIRVGRPTNTDQYQEMIDSTIEKSKNQA